MSEEEPPITKYILFDTNIIWSFIDAVKQDEELYKDLLDDLEKFVTYKKYSLYVSDSIKKELGQITDIRDFDRFFQEKRLHNPRINFLKIKNNHPLIAILQPLFKGNLDESTGLRKPEDADHTLIINGVELLKNREDSISVVIYSNDHEVEDVIKDLATILPREYSYTAKNIFWKAGFQLLAEMLQYAKTLGLISDLENILANVTKKYYELREKTPNKYQVVELLLDSLKTQIEETKYVNERNKNLEKINIELGMKIGLGKEDLQEYYKNEEIKKENNELLKKSLTSLENNSLNDLEKNLQKQELRNYSSLLTTYYGIVKSNKSSLHRYYHEWNKVYTSKKTYLNKEFEKLLDKNVFMTMVQQVYENFKSNKFDKAHNLYMELMPLLAEVSWEVADEAKNLEQYYVIGLYLALYKNNLSEYEEIIEILTIALEDMSCTSEQIKQHVEFSKLIINQRSLCTINQIFKSQIINNIKEFFLSRHWTLVWNLLVPFWQCLDQSERDELKDILEYTYWVTLGPPGQLYDRWEEINYTERINISEDLLERGLMDSDIDQITKGYLPDFLKGEHLVIDTKMVDRAHIIIHVKQKNSRFGIELHSKEPDLSNAQTIEFTTDSIKTYKKRPHKDEVKYKICGIIELNPNPNLLVTERKNILDNIIL